jgi:two-component system chemotaxis response regulator CheY
MQGYNILVVEDSPVMRQLIAQALRRLQGAKVEEADDGLVGLRKLGDKKFDLVILDLNMPIMNGLKLIAHIRSTPEIADLPILVITTEGMEEDKERAIELGANLYLTKPVEASRILEAAKKLLSFSV